MNIMIKRIWILFVTPSMTIGGSLFTVALVVGLAGCDRLPRNKSHAQVAEESVLEGRRLAAVYCQSCHELPDPAVLNAKSWEKGVLPQMGPRLGIFYNGFDRYPSSRGDTNVPRGYYPSQPLLKPEEWQHIVDYYTAVSPDSLPGQVRPHPVQMGLPLFEARVPAMRYEMPATSLVRVDTVGKLDIFDVHYQKLYQLSSGLGVRDSVRVAGGIVDLERQVGGWLACNIGMLNPNNGKFGRLERVFCDSGGMKVDSIPLATGLRRPVQAQAADLNGDGRIDYLVCEFGNLVGGLSWLENKGDGRFDRHVLRAAPGAIRAYVNDYNHDGRPDIWALFAQGDEGVFLFTNRGGGQFDSQTLLRWPPSYGSSYFELADFNGDGFADIVYTCGDNADFSPVLKPYHGVYIYLNDGHNGFRPWYFFPINGCYKAVARDFDGDGDLDLAAIAFFPDFSHQPEEGFVYLENRGGGDFRPYSLPEAQRGKWLTMDVGDLDGDGRADIVLGNFSFYAPVTKAGVDFKQEAPFLFLRNTGRKE